MQNAKSAIHKTNDSKAVLAAYRGESEEDMKYYIETWETEEMIACFDTEEEREKYINEMTVEVNGKNGRYLRYDTNIRVAIYDC